MTAESQSVARAIKVLELLAEHGTLGVREIARRMELSPTIVHRLISTLAVGGYAEQSADNQKYRIGYRAYQIGCSFLSHNNLDRASTPDLVALAEQHQVSSFLGVLRGDAIVYLKVVPSNGPIVINNAPGSLAAPHSTAFGKVLLAARSDKEVAEIMGTQPYKRLTKKTKTSLRALLADLRVVRATDIAISDEENLVNVFSAGAPVRDASGMVIASLSGAVPRQGMTKKDMDRLCDLVKSAADRVSRKMGAAQLPPNGSRTLVR
jgi:DNA-binding IclR family transcriptional regulator